MSYLLDRAIALCNKFGLSTEFGDYKTALVGNGVDQYQTIESRAGRLVRRLEDYLDITPRGLLGARFAVVEKKAKPLVAPKVLITDGHYSVQLLQDHPGLEFIFGDNFLRVGKGGQAIIRGEPNAVGVATKRHPGNAPGDFFAEGNVGDMGQVCEDLITIVNGLKAGKRYVVPVTPEGRISLGCGLANLPYYAPSVYAFIERWFDAIKKEYGYGQL